MKLGPITILTTKRANAYSDLHFKAGELHQMLWFSDDWAKDREMIMEQVMDVGESLSYLPDFYFD